MNFIFIQQLCVKDKEKIGRGLFQVIFLAIFWTEWEKPQVPDVPRQGFTPDITQLDVRRNAAEQHRGLWDKEVSVVVNVRVVQWNSEWAVPCC
jgi:hypothetical protein